VQALHRPAKLEVSTMLVIKRNVAVGVAKCLVEAVDTSIVWL